MSKRKNDTSLRTFTAWQSKQVWCHVLLVLHLFQFNDCLENRLLAVAVKGVAPGVVDRAVQGTVGCRTGTKLLPYDNLGDKLLPGDNLG